MDRSRRGGQRFFPIGLRLFFAAALASLLVVALGGIVQMRVLGALGFACAVLGMGACALGMRVVNPLQWRARIARIEWTLGMRDYPPYARNQPELVVVETK
jgi:hypothetical protein